MKIYCLLFALGFTTALQAQNKLYQFTLSAGAGTTLGLHHLKMPGYKATLYAEKTANIRKTYFLALEYLQQPPIAAITEPDAPGSAVMATTTFHKVTVVSLNIGGREYFKSGFFVGAGLGIGMFSQIYPTHTYSDGSRYYEQYEHGIGDGGLSHLLQVGFAKGKFQLCTSMNSIWIPFRFTVDVDYERATPQYLSSFGITAGYTL